jgi:hypothetical protein
MKMVAILRVIEFGRTASASMKAYDKSIALRWLLSVTKKIELHYLFSYL